VAEAVHSRRKTDDCRQAEDLAVARPHIRLADEIPEEQRRVAQENLFVPRSGHKRPFQEFPHTDFERGDELDIIAAEENESGASQQKNQKEYLPPQRRPSEELSQRFGMHSPLQISQKHEQGRQEERRFHPGKAPQPKHRRRIAEESRYGQPSGDCKKETPDNAEPRSPPAVKSEERRLDDDEDGSQGSGKAACGRKKENDHTREENNSGKDSEPSRRRPPCKRVFSVFPVIGSAVEKPLKKAEHRKDKGKRKGKGADESRPPWLERLRPAELRARRGNTRRQGTQLFDKPFKRSVGRLHGRRPEDEKANRALFHRPDETLVQCTTGDVAARNFLVGHAMQRNKPGIRQPVQLGSAYLPGKFDHRHGTPLLDDTFGKGAKIRISKSDFAGRGDGANLGEGR